MLALAVAREALLITNDLDFGTLVFRDRAHHTGVLLLRLGEMPYNEQAELVAAVVVSDAEAMKGRFSVLMPGRLRIGGGP